MISFKQLGKYGRLGNCLFQAAATIALAKRNNDQYVFPPWQEAEYFNLHNCFSNHIKVINQYEELNYRYAEISYKPNLNLHGYFQSEKYFKDFADDIRDILTPNESIYEFDDVTSIHVRRTDYLQFPNHHPVCSMSYYEKAMEKIGGKFLIFSDDIRWCKEHFIGNDFDFAEGNSHITDLALQIGCSNNIIANSSFSWWGAWLNNNVNKIVVAPKNWFGPALASTHPIDDLIPEGWILI